jgi:CHAT domain-containing protein
MFRFCSLLFILLLVLIYPQSQGIKEIPPYEQLYRKAEKLYASADATATTDSTALSIYQQVASSLKQKNIYNPVLLDCYLKSGILEMSGNNQQQALSFFNEATAVFFKCDHLPDSLLFQPYLYAGSVHYTLNDLDSAKYYYSKAEAINATFPLIQGAERLFNKLGALYYETGDYRKSIRYFEKALSVVENNKASNAFFIVNYKNNIATAWLKLHEYEKAIQIFNAVLPYKMALNELYYNMANAYMGEGNYETALHFLRLMQQMELEKYNATAKVFLGQKQYDSAATYINRAVRLYADAKKFSPKINYGITLTYSGDLKVATGKPLEAITDYQLAIQYLAPVFKDANIANNPLSFSGLQNFSLLFDVLTAKANALKIMDSLSPNHNYLQYALNAYVSSAALAKHIEHIYFSDDARLFLKTKVTPATQQAVAVAISLFNQTKDKQYLQTAFGFAENNKASVLQAGLQQQELSSVAGLPADLLATEKKYKALIAKIGIQLSQVKDSLSLSTLQKENEDAEINLAAIQEKLDQDPLYHQLKFSNTTVTTEMLRQKMLSKNEAILSYYYTTDSLLCFYITNDEIGYSATTLKEDFFLSVVSLRQQLETPAASSRSLLQQSGAVLFDDLILPVYSKIKNAQHLVIIPYNEISYVPFEMLFNSAEGSLLLNKYAISYNYTAGLLSDKSSQPSVNYNVLAMAPFSEKNNTSLVLPALPSSGEEIRNLPGKEIAGSQATKARFEILSEQYPVIHLATHAVVNDTNALGSYIEFYGKKTDADTSHRLYEREIYNLDMKAAKLVILSACETGSGELVNGEGVISLSRAFSYAGCKSVITTLWKADDIATAFIIKRLHHYLQKGFKKDEALQKAKIDYLSSSEIDTRFKSPAYWAHLVLIGDQQALVNKSNNWYFLIAVATALSLLAVILYRKTGQK